jgi:DNA (cytosine-5)-methyltransferase 1
MVLRRHYPDVDQHDDVRNFNSDLYDAPDAVIWGSPCQDLSVAGKRAGIGGKRSSLFYEGIRIVSALVVRGTRYSVWENVDHARSSHRGQDFRIILEETCRASGFDVSIPMPLSGGWQPSGYIMGKTFSVAWRTFDSQYFGVPQRRRRIFVVADFAGQSASKILLERQSLLGSSSPRGRERKANTGDIAHCLRARYQNCQNESTFVTQILYDSHPADSRLTEAGEVANTVKARYGTGGGNTPLVLGTLGSHHFRGSADEIDKLVVGFPSYGINDPNEVGMPNVRGENPPAVMSNDCIRRLTPVECCRLMGWPDDWNEWGIDEKGKKRTMSDAQRYKQCGNGVVSLHAAWIAKRFIDSTKGNTL